MVGWLQSSGWKILRILEIKPSYFQGWIGRMAAEFRMEDIKDIREQTILKIQELSLEPSNSGLNFQVFSFYSNDLLLESFKY